ncbi:hypothetical protein [Enterobacter hormaechei]|uniref:hypothetical protein n=1 Tax=Enterobacter hormaechei TaxID=158836 RepID=UPI0007980253|nr:hypothetical protein [Enterobacter hormaechei]MDX7008014.1 hypothetical protein [Enterobacter hormaechei]SAD50925.1 Uncharacterised protein [Enterobacter hormaechei]VAE06786.1 Uncharacterised protein [Enterobacter hormaechei]
MSIKNLVQMIKHNGLLVSMAQLEKLYQVAIENEKKLAELEAHLAALAAENAGLKDEISNITFMRDDDFFGSTQRAQEVMGRLVNVKTPATDAFLAEVRAAAVDEVCLKISNAIVNCYQDEQVGLDAAATICGDFAAQLRKGVQS